MLCELLMFESDELCECILTPIYCCLPVVFVLVGSAVTQIDELKLQGNEMVMLEAYSIFTLVLK